MGLAEYVGTYPVLSTSKVAHSMEGKSTLVMKDLKEEVDLIAKTTRCPSYERIERLQPNKTRILVTDETGLEFPIFLDKKIKSTTNLRELRELISTASLKHKILGFRFLSHSNTVISYKGEASFCVSDVVSTKGKTPFFKIKGCDIKLVTSQPSL